MKAAVPRGKPFLVFAVGAILALAATTTLARAASPGAPTRGDAQAVFNATFTGGSAIRAHNAEAEGAPGQVSPTPDGVRIDPILDNLSYCQEGWHLISLGLFDDPALYDSNQALFEVLGASDIQFVLDGVSLEVERTAVTRFADVESLGLEAAFGVNFGAFLAPGSLSVGTHELRFTLTQPGFEDFDSTISFSVVSC